MNPGIDENESKKVVGEFCHLLEKSKHLFNGLRDLPTFGYQQWHLYFCRTFDTYSRLWKYQQQHRQILDYKYGLKRWQIGEIASKIGQLYYQYYLRTGETNLLLEAFSFYAAIRDRAYYTNASNEQSCDLMVKKLRYYSRFIVVCILLKKMKLARELMNELERQVHDYAGKYSPTDESDWCFLIEEVKMFLHAEAVVAVTNTETNDKYKFISPRLSPITIPSIERLPIMCLKLEQIIIVGCYGEQLKVSDMTMDMYRMVLALEREPDVNRVVEVSPQLRSKPMSPEPICMQGSVYGQLHRSNPHKFLMYQPVMAQLLLYLASCHAELTTEGVLLVYISAEGWVSPGNTSIDVSYERGGILTNNSEIREGFRISDKASNRKERCLHPGDLLPFTRRSMILIVESDNASIFQYIPRIFGQPLLVLMAPQQLPPYFLGHQHNGSLFTLYLHSPILAFLYTCDVTTVNEGLLPGAQQFLDNFYSEAYRLMNRIRIDVTFLQFMGDEFVRVIILKFIFCNVVLHMHNLFRGRNFRPKSSPVLPESEFLQHPTLVDIIFDLASYFELAQHFRDPVLEP